MKDLGSKSIAWKREHANTLFKYLIQSTSRVWLGIVCLYRQIEKKIIRWCVVEGTLWCRWGVLQFNINSIQRVRWSQWKYWKICYCCCYCQYGEMIKTETTTTAAAASAANDIMSNVKCVLNFDQFSYQPGQTIRCFVTLTFSEELKYRSEWLIKRDCNVLVHF